MKYKNVIQYVRQTCFLMGCCWFSGLHAFASADSTATSTHKVKVFFNFDARKTFIQQKHLNIFGINAGITYGERRNRITVGYNWLGANASQSLVHWRKILSQTLNLSYYKATDVRFVNFAYWHTAIRNKRWVLSTPLEAGIGNESSEFRTVSGSAGPKSRKDYFIPLQVGVYGEYRAFRWLGFNSQAGYRNAFSSGEFRRRFSGLYYSLGITFYPENIREDFKKWSGNRNKSSQD